MSAEQNNDPGSFHFLAAGFVKDLLAARVRTDPDFVVSPEMRKRWELDADETKSYTTERLLRCSLERFSKICDWPIDWDTSCSDPPTDEEIVSDVYCHVKDFINREALDNAIAAEKNGQPIDWENGFHWDELDKIRERLDLLPHPPDQPAKSERVQLFRQNHDPVALIDGKPASPLTEAQYNVVQTLLEAGENGLTKDELDRRSGHTDARKILGRLADKQDWAQVIPLPGTSGKRYRIL